ncbi:MAG TPA: hypothetical protein VGL58_04115 [Caulobacteraceae bacterium]|jgi:hypothetical protein
MALALCVAAVAGAAAAADFYLDPDLGDLKPEDRVVIAHPQPVQLLFQFETKGAPNARATKAVKDKVVETVKASGLFSDVSDQPQADGAILSITIDDAVNADDMKSAERQGFMTGLTFGMAASTAVDHYNCVIDFVAGPAAPKLTRTSHHDLTFQMGLSKTPPTGLVKMANATDAVNTMVRQVIATPLNDLAKDPGFASADAPAAASPATPPTPAVDPATPPPNAAPAQS